MVAELIERNPNTVKHFGEKKKIILGCGPALLLPCLMACRACILVLGQHSYGRISLTWRKLGAVFLRVPTRARVPGVPDGVPGMHSGVPGVPAWAPGVPGVVPGVPGGAQACILVCLACMLGSLAFLALCLACLVAPQACILVCLACPLGRLAFLALCLACLMACRACNLHETHMHAIVLWLKANVLRRSIISMLVHV